MRHAKVKKRETAPDKIYGSRLVAKFINSMMKDGKKTIAEGLFYDAITKIGEKEKDPVSFFERAIANVGPKQEIKARRVGGASYQIPIEVRGERKTSLAIRWIIMAAKARSNKEFHSFSEKLAAEITDAVNNQGAAIQKRDTALRQAEANKAFSHFRW